MHQIAAIPKITKIMSSKNSLKYHDNKTISSLKTNIVQFVKSVKKKVLSILIFEAVDKLDFNNEQLKC